VPSAVPGIAFLSGGQFDERACANLAAINAHAARDGRAPWRLTFWSRHAPARDALHTWNGVAGCTADAQDATGATARRCGEPSPEGPVSARLGP